MQPIEVKRELRRIALNTESIDTDHVVCKTLDCIIELESENERLRELIREAYDEAWQEGHSAGQDGASWDTSRHRNVDSDSCWLESDALAALNPKNSQ
jgi:hypothetical protein